MSIIDSLEDNQFTWLVTGAAGFIGSNLVETLLNYNQRVIGLDNFSTGYKNNVKEIEKLGGNFTFIEGDICDLNICHQAVSEVDFVLHQAALGSVPRSLKSPELTNAANVNGFVNMLVAAKSAKVKRFVYASSSSVYGDSTVLPKQESHLGKPLSPYAASKYIDEVYADVFACCYGLESIGLRYFNVFGKRQDPNGAYAAVIPTWVLAMLTNKELYINGDGTTSRDFCYIDNVVEANILAALSDNDQAINQIYNIAAGDQTSLNELFAVLKSLLQKDNNYLPKYLDFREGDVKHSLADITKAEELLGYSPKVKVKEGLRLTADWYKQNINCCG